MFLVRNSSINDSERGTGIGVAMYICATEEAAARGGALSPEYCLGYGGTSDSARRVWSSKRLAAAVAVFDECLAYGGAEIEPGAFASSASR